MSDILQFAQEQHKRFIVSYTYKIVQLNINPSKARSHLARAELGVELDVYGREGWELVQFLEKEGEYARAVFKQRVVTLPGVRPPQT